MPHKRKLAQILPTIIDKVDCIELLALLAPQTFFLNGLKNAKLVLI